MTVDEAAAAIFAVQNAQTADLVRKVVVESGRDPSEFVMYAFGGAGPVHCFAYGADLGVQATVVPLGSSAAAFSAYGLAASDVSIVKEISDPGFYPVPSAKVNEVFEGLERDAREALAKQHIDFTEIVIHRQVDVRYTMQLAELAAPAPSGILTETDVAGIVAAFEERYAQAFGKGTGFAGAGFQFITYRVRAVGVMPTEVRLPTAEPANGLTVEQAIVGHRPVLIDPARGFEVTPIYDYLKLRPGHTITGPAIVEVPTTTVTVSANDTAKIDHLGNLVLTHGTETQK
jgi:N-methylhydantoinase A